MNEDVKSFAFGMAWADQYGFSQAIGSGNILYVSGQLWDMKANFVGEGDFELQVRTTFENLDRVLEAHGASKEQIVETMVYVKDFPRAHRGHQPAPQGVFRGAPPPAPSSG